MRAIIFLLITGCAVSNLSWADDSTSAAGQDPTLPPNQTHTQVTPSPTPPVHVVGVRQGNEVHGQPSSAGSLDESNGRNMGMGIQFNLGKPKSNEPQDKDNQKDEDDND